MRMKKRKRRAAVAALASKKMARTKKRKNSPAVVAEPERNRVIPPLISPTIKWRYEARLVRAFSQRTI
jgi:hypothetical protein